MIRNNILTSAIIGVLVVVLAAPTEVFAQTDQNEQTAQSKETAKSKETGQTFSKADLDQMLEPIALYPDSLLVQILIAATYPSQVVEADRWVKENKGLSEDRLNAAVDKKDWDPNVKALAAHREVLAMMDEHLDWTTSLGEAFLARQKDVLASVQELRHKNYAEANLKTAEHKQKSTHSQLKTSHKTQIAKKYSHHHYRRHYASHRDYYYQRPGLSINTPFFDINLP
jgi:hypothetical protein